MTTVSRQKEIKIYKHYCGRCKNGWIQVNTGDPEYPTAMRPCQCNPKAQEKVNEYKDYLERDPHQRAGEEASLRRIAEARLNNQSKLTDQND